MVVRRDASSLAEAPESATLRVPRERAQRFEGWIAAAFTLHVLACLGYEAIAKLTAHPLGAGLPIAALEIEAGFEPTPERPIPTAAIPPPASEEPTLPSMAPSSKPTAARLPAPALPSSPAPSPEPLERRAHRALAAAADAVAAAAKALVHDDQADEAMAIASSESDTLTSGAVAADGQGMTGGRNPQAAIGGKAGGAGKSTSPDAVVGPDRSRRALVMGGLDDACSFPREADVAHIDHATAIVAVHVRADGRAARVTIVNDPGHGFGAAAYRCALQAQYSPARDRSGKPIGTDLERVSVRFTR